jgi:hypothetical protein
MAILDPPNTGRPALAGSELKLPRYAYPPLCVKVPTNDTAPVPGFIVIELVV